MDLCYGTIRVVEENYTDKLPQTSWGEDRPPNVKRKRLTCPICKRRLMSSISWDYNGEVLIHTLPPHKPKMWWKKHKRRKEKTSANRIR